MRREIPEKDKLDALVNVVIALCEWHATEGNPRYTLATQTVSGRQGSKEE